MTSTAVRPVRPRRPAPDEVADPQQALLAGGAAGASAAGLGVLLLAVPVLLVWWAEDRTGSGVVDALRGAAQLWLVAHGVELELVGGRVGLLPLGLALLPVWLCWRAGSRAARGAQASTARGVLPAVGGIVLLYTALAVAVALVSTADGVRPVAWTAVAGPLLLAAAAAWGGALRTLPTTALPRVVSRPAVLVAGTAAALGLLAGGALLVAVALALELRPAAEVAGASQAGAVGGLGLALLGVVLAPNAAVWGASWLAGPGFAVGVGTAVGPFGVALGPVPALPLLVALPAGAPPSALAVLTLAVPLLVGVLVGALLLDRSARWGRRTADAALTGAVAGGLLGLLAALSGGPLGGHRLTEVGPSAWRVALAVALPVALGALAGGRLPRRAADPPDQPPG